MMSKYILLLCLIAVGNSLPTDIPGVQSSIAGSKDASKIEASNLPQAAEPIQNPQAKSAPDSASSSLSSSSSSPSAAAAHQSEEKSVNVSEEKASSPSLETFAKVELRNQAIPFVTTSFILPGSNLNLENKIELKSSEPLEAAQDGKLDDQNKLIKPEATAFQTSQHLLYSAPAAIPTIPAIPAAVPVYTIRHPIQYIPSIPSFYF